MSVVGNRIYCLTGQSIEVGESVGSLVGMLIGGLMHSRIGWRTSGLMGIDILIYLYIHSGSYDAEGWF